MIRSSPLLKLKYKFVDLNFFFLYNGIVPIMLDWDRVKIAEDDDYFGLEYNMYNKWIAVNLTILNVNINLQVWGV